MAIHRTLATVAGTTLPPPQYSHIPLFRQFALSLLTVRVSPLSVLLLQNRLANGTGLLTKRRCYHL